MKNLFLAMILSLYCTTATMAECTKESQSHYCGSIAEAIEHALKMKTSVYVIDRNYHGLQPVTAEVKVHGSFNSPLTLWLAERILDFYTTETPASKLIYCNEAGDKLFRLHLTTIGRHPDHTDCIRSTLWIENVDGSEAKNLLPNLNSLLCVVNNAVILVSSM